MNTRDIVFSVSLHLLALAIAIFASPLGPVHKHDFTEVIRVSAVTLPAPAGSKMEPISTPEVPTPVPEEEFNIPIKDPTTQPEVSTDKKKPPKKSLKKPDKKKQPTKKSATPSTPATTEPKTSDISAAEGSPFAGATIDNAAFDYPIWFRQVFNKIAGNMRHSVVTDATLICVIYFQVLQSGRIVNLKVIQSSGYQEFDDACMAAVSRSAPFPPLPRDFTDEIIGITLPIKYTP